MEIVQFLLRANNKVCKLDLPDKATHCKLWKSWNFCRVGTTRFANLTCLTKQRIVNVGNPRLSDKSSLQTLLFPRSRNCTISIIYNALLRQTSQVCKPCCSHAAEIARFPSFTIRCFVRQIKFANLVDPTLQKLQDLLHFQCVSRSLAEAKQEPSRSLAGAKQ